MAFFHSMAAGEMPSIVSEGGDGAELTQFICGFLGCDLRPCNPVLDALPAMVHLRAATRSTDRMRHLIDFALCELREPSSGGRGVLLRLAELMFVEVVRRHLRNDGRRRRRLAGRSARSAGRAHAVAAARRTDQTLDTGGTRGAGRHITFGAGRTLCAFRRSTSNAVPHAVAHAAGDPPARRAGREEVAAVARGSRLRIGGRHSAAHSRSASVLRLPRGDCARRPDARAIRTTRKRSIARPAVFERRSPSFNHPVGTPWRSSN